MKASAWFSARLRIAILQESMGRWGYMECVHIFSAADWKEAFARALTCGRAHEQEYTNESGLRVRWRLAEVVTLDQLAGSELDGIEVYSELAEVPEPDGTEFDHVFTPELSDPRQTL